MAYKDYNRYNILKNDDGTIDTMPFVNIPINSSDKYEYWQEGISRLDRLSNKYYGNPTFDWIILLANNQYVSEYDIKDGDLIRIAFPLNKAKADYDAALLQYKK
jgi:hypothetical protein